MLVTLLGSSESTKEFLRPAAKESTCFSGAPPFRSSVRTSSSPPARFLRLGSHLQLFSIKVSYSFLRQIAACGRAAITRLSVSAHAPLLSRAKTRTAPLAKPKDPASSPATERAEAGPGASPQVDLRYVWLQEGAAQFESSQCQMGRFDVSFLCRSLGAHSPDSVPV